MCARRSGARSSGSWSTGYQPRYSSLDALHESLRWLAANGHVDVGDQDV
jgi:hypothetical protein